jgi:hypothetical protein
MSRAKKFAIPRTELGRLEAIASIIQQVDQRAMAADGPVTPTLQEMTQDEMRRIYALAKGDAKYA